MINVTATLFALIVGVVLIGNSVQAANLLVNPSFELNSGREIPTGWTRFAPPTAQVPPNLWIEAAVPPQSGALHFKQWGASYNGTNNAAGLIQEFSSAPGSTYQASGWFYTGGGDVLGADCKVWLEVSFLGSSSNLLALYRSDDFTAGAGTDTWIQYPVNKACDISSPVSIGDPFFNTYAVTGSVAQLVAPVGSTKVRYRFVYLQIANQGGSCYFDSAVLDQVSGPVPPLISNLFPQNMIFVNPADGITFNVSSPSGFTINNSGIGLVVNGLDVSGSLNITGSSSNKNVSYLGLQSNLTYNVSITVTDSLDLTASASTYFETTWVGVPRVLYSWEAEDFDFTNGMYFNHPILCDTVGTPNCYFGKVGDEGVDEHVTGTAPNHVYRPDDAVGTLISGDYARKDYALAGVFDYRIDPFNTDMWLNYTRDWTNGTYWVIGRLSTDVGLNGSLILSVVNPDTTTTELGRFTINGGRGWSTFENVYLKDTNGNNALVMLNGKQTLRVTSVGNLLPNFFMLVAAQADLPQLSNVYPTGTHPFEYTNALRFTVSTLGSSFPADGIRVILDGYDVSSNLVITGTASTKSVVYPTLLPNAIHTAIISATNVLGNGIAVTNRFDTFSEANFMVEAEDFDYDGGQFIPDAIPNSYVGLGAATNIDFQHLTLSGEFFAYRSDGIPQDYLNQPVQHDWVRSNFVYWGGVDYILTYFAGTDWANYTREYPAGNYHVYIRTSGDGAFSMYLDQVVSGAGTANQTTRRLGRFGAVGKDYITYAWVPLTDDGLSAPAVVKLNGLTTLRLATDGNCNPNFFMLVPAGGITLTATQSPGQIALSFPTQAGINYRVFYRTNLAEGNWTLLTSFLGDGTVKSVTDPATGTSRFYKVSSP
ncbi:MAG TPA: hypothetical protein VFZ59_01505 [Verrucomicrobiae bacterium]|nr:hypothetical protein [Verrucomicrobiae bacterium]